MAGSSPGRLRGRMMARAASGLRWAVAPALCALHSPCPIGCCTVIVVFLFCMWFSPADRPERPPYSNHTTKSIAVSAYTIFCSKPNGPKTTTQIRWLREVFGQMRIHLDEVGNVLVLYCYEVERELVEAFGVYRKILQPLPTPWFYRFDWVQMNNFLLSPEFWALTHGDRVLIFQPDVWICPGALKRLHPYLQYDFVGAPWGRGYQRSCPTGVGNGGFSMRDRALSFSIALDPKTPALVAKLQKQYGPNEDIIWCHLFRMVGANVPTPAIAAGFSVENDDFGATAPVAAHDCTYQTTVHKLEAGCPGISARMAEIQQLKKPLIWALQTYTYPLWVVADRLFILWILRYYLLTGTAIVAALFHFTKRHCTFQEPRASE